MSVIIRLQNLPWSANALDIRQYFRGLSIPEGGVHIVGGEQGDAFIAFSTDEDARQAMMMDGGKIKEVKIKLLLSSRAEMQKVIELARQQSMTLQNFMQMPLPSITPTPLPVQNLLPSVMNQVPSATPPTIPEVIQSAAPLIPDRRDSREADRDKKDSDSVTSNKDKKDRKERSRSRDGDRRDRKDRDRDRYRDRDRDRRRRDRSRSRDRERSRRRDRRDRSRSRERSRSRDRTSRDRDRDSKRGLRDTKHDSDTPLIEEDKTKDQNGDVVVMAHFPQGKMNQTKQQDPPNKGSPSQSGSVNTVGWDMPAGPMMGNSIPSFKPSVGTRPLPMPIETNPGRDLEGRRHMGGPNFSSDITRAPLSGNVPMGSGDSGPGSFLRGEGYPGSREPSLPLRSRESWPPGRQTGEMGRFSRDRISGYPLSQGGGFSDAEDYDGHGEVESRGSFRGSYRGIGDFRRGSFPPREGRMGSLAGGSLLERMGPGGLSQSELDDRRSGTFQHSDRRMPYRMDRNEQEFPRNDRYAEQFGRDQLSERPFLGRPGTFPGDRFARERYPGGDRNFETRQQDISTRQQDIPARSDLPIRQQDMSMRQQDMPMRQQDMPMRQQDIPMRQQDMPMRQQDMSTRQHDMPMRQEMPTRQQEMPPRQIDMPGRQPDMLTRQPDMSTRQKDMPTRQQELPVRQDLPTRQQELPARQQNISTAVELRNMPIETGYGEIRRFLQGLHIAGSGLKIINDNHGNRVGIAYVKFQKRDDKEEALKFTGRTIRGSVIEVLHLNDDIFDKAIDSYKPPPEPEPAIETSEKKEAASPFSCLSLKDLPPYVKEQDIYKLFKDIPIQEIILLESKDGKKQHIGFVKFGKPEDARKALYCNSKHTIGHKAVTVAPCSVEEMQEMKESENGMDLEEDETEEKILPDAKESPQNTKPQDSHQNEVVEVPVQEPQKMPLIQTDCILLKGLPTDANDRDILDFFSDVGLVPLRIHIMLDKFNNPIGDAFCEFSSIEEAARSCSKNNMPLGKQEVSVQPVMRSEMNESLGVVSQHELPMQPMGLTRMQHPRDFNNRSMGLLGISPSGPLLNRMPLLGRRHLPSQSQISPVDGFGKPGCVVAAENIPFKANIDEILDFFRDFDVNRESVIRRFNDNGTATGDARVAFVTPSEAQRAVRELRFCKIRGRPIYLRLL